MATSEHLAVTTFNNSTIFLPICRILPGEGWRLASDFKSTSYPPANRTLTLSRGITRKYFSEGAKAFFLNFFPAWNAFPDRKFPFWWTQNKFSSFGKVKSKKKIKKKGLLLILELFPPSIFNFPPSLLPFSFFSYPFSPFSIFSFPLFPGRSVEISRSEVSGGGTLPPYPPSVTPQTLSSPSWNKLTQYSIYKCMERQRLSANGSLRPSPPPPICTSLVTSLIVGFNYISQA